MAVLIHADLGDDTEVMCSACDAVFAIIYQPTADVDAVNFCPFCGEEIEDTEEEDVG